MKNLRTIKIKGIRYIKNNRRNVPITFFDFSENTQLRKIHISPPKSKSLVDCSEIKGLDKCTLLREIIISNTNISNLDGFPLSNAHPLEFIIKNTKEILTLPEFSENTKISYLGLENLTVHSISPLINITLTRWLYFRNVTLINPLTQQEKIILLNNQNISNNVKQRILELSLNAKNPKSSIRLR